MILEAIRTPRLRLLAAAEPGQAERGVILVRGYLTDGCPSETWAGFLRRQGWRGNVYLLDWSTGGALTQHALGAMAGNALVVGGFRMAARSIPTLRGVVTGGRAALWGWRAFRAATIATSVVAGMAAHWRRQARAADTEGRCLGAYLVRQRPPWARAELRLVGHSLGARVIHAALSSAGRYGQCAVDHVDLYGGALATSTSWTVALRAVGGEVRNFHSARDRVLSTLFVAAEAGIPIGTAPLPPPPGAAGASVRNLDVTDVVSGHADYVQVGVDERFRV